ncbi:hypothetical protein PYCCODRAFT_255188 [Trametes coccinea BRFM310]|uniref:F-box domain-containing protein n=1 Tax=Trametes coccinea (strain BRFM310) TaxID=1353009 RepID=A0A1Y2IST3_TRAC3|nr:hypothetical protein PYCCODRAFT_255188 [Trametes coccinea BRFM310]
MESLWTSYRPPAILQEDLLHYIFDHVADLATLARASTVCRVWVVPAQAALYKDIEYTPLSQCSRHSLLARTMRTRPQLLRFVRRLSLITTWTHSPTPELCAWVEHIPEDRLQEFRWTWDRGHPLPALLAFPAIRATRHIELRGRLYTMGAIQSILELPSLESLTLELSGDEKGSLDVTSSRLRRLSVIAREGHSPSLDSLLAVVGPQIESLHITCKLGGGSERDAALVSCIHSHCPDLSRLEVDAITPSDAPTVIASALVKQYHALEYLRCGQGTLSPELFSSLPSSLRTLNMAFIPTLEEPLLRFLEEQGHNHRSLTLLELSSADTNVSIHDYPRISAVCNISGVDLRLRNAHS